MFGVNMGYQPKINQTTIKKYAWFPIKTTSKKRVWINEYYVIRTYYDENGRPPIKGLFWELVLSKNEYLVWLLQQSTNKPTLPKKSVYYYQKEF